MINLDRLFAQSGGSDQTPREAEPERKPPIYYSITQDEKESIEGLKAELKADIEKGELPGGLLLKALKIVCKYDADQAYYDALEKIIKKEYGILTLQELPENFRENKQQEN
ncbi:MAG: hypothetical protein IK121_02985 [Lachnospiraceae bacterium]|nr:hypothetical protein [Lachnospiraceae bacterium]